MIYEKNIKIGKKTSTHFRLIQRWYSYITGKAYIRVGYFENIEDAKGLDMEYAKAKQDKDFNKPIFEQTFEFNFGKEVTEKELRDKVLKIDIHKDAKFLLL